MPNLYKKEYEISIWEDVLITEYYGKLPSIKNDKFTYAEAQAYMVQHGLTDFNKTFNTVQYFDEEKVAVIGSNLMNTPIRAQGAQLKRNVNGENTLSFYIYLQYYDEIEDTYKKNPYSGELVVNERKLKLFYNNEWYDFIIKTVDEDSENNTVNVTATDMHINELSKTGFNVELDTDLNNNIGTINDLAEIILDGTEWNLNTDESDKFYERQESHLYQITTKNVLSAISMTLGDAITIPSNKTIYGFYSSVSDYEDGKSSSIQIVYDENNNYQIDQDRIIYERIDDEKYTADEYIISNFNDNDISIGSVSDVYKGRQLIHSTSCTYDSVAGKVVERYKDNYNNEIYMYYETKYAASSITASLITNGEKFANSEYWVPNSGSSITNPVTIQKAIYPSLSDDFSIESFHNFLRVHNASLDTNHSILNKGFVSNFSDSKGFSESDKYVFRISYGKSQYNEYGVPTSIPSKISGGNGIKDIKVRDYKYNSDGGFEFGSNIYFDFDTSASSWYSAKGYYGMYNEFSGTSFSPGILYYEKEGDNYKETEDSTPSPSKKYYYKSIANNYIYCIATCQEAIAYSKMLSGIRDYTGNTSGWDIGIFIEFESLEEGYDYFIEGIQFFKYQENESSFNPGPNDILLPGMISTASISKYYYYYYKPNESMTSAEDLVYLYKGTEIQSQYQPIYSSEAGLDKYEKIRTITAKESNRFNLIQSLCELFECWAKFVIDRNAGNGKIQIKYIKDDEGIYCETRQKKSIKFLQYVGKENYAGFKYGINLKQTVRNIDSGNIVTKLIVKDNTNEHAQNGFCTIARADQNPNYSNFILNADYYIRQGMLSTQQWVADLYNDTNGHLGYYKLLKQYKKDFEELSLEQSEIQRTIDNLEANQKTYSKIVSSSVDERTDLISQMYVYINQSPQTCTLDQLLNELKNGEGRSEDTSAKNYLSQYYTLTQNIQYYNLMLTNVETELVNANTRKTNIKNYIAESKEEINKVESAFYKKYSRFIQEGSWTSEDYVDDSLYYLDAKSILYTSAFPQVSYNISVIELSALDEFKSYSYSVGDKSFIEDTEFFGYYYNDGIPTPYQEEIIVSETNDYLDNPEQNSITVQNYKTQFEDLFQRITATTQSLQYSSGEYSRAAGVVTSDQTIDATVLQNSVANNSIILSNTKDQSTEIGNDGITSTNLANPSEIIRITSGGLFISKDGGLNFNTGVTANGINTSLLTAGQINAENIAIYSGSFPTFKWNKYGLNAFAFSNTSSYSVDYGKFVRYDQYGIYGIQGMVDHTWVAGNDPSYSSPLDEIEDKGSFGLIWDRFFLKSNTNYGGMVKISSENEIQVFDSNENERVRIGRITDFKIDDVYGIRIKDSSNNSVLETGSDGNLWLKNLLKIGTNNTSIVSIGYDPVTTIDFKGHNTHKVINANNNFVVYEDGCFEGKNAKVSGEIIATSGKIGNLDVEEVEGSVNNNRRIEVIASAGLSFKTSSSGITTPASTTLSLKAYGFTTASPTITSVVWKYSTDLINWINLSTNYPFEFVYTDQKALFQNNQLFIKAEAIVNGSSFTSIISTIQDIVDGAPGEKGDNATVWRAEVSLGQILRYYTGERYDITNDGNIQLRVYSQTDGISTLMTPSLDQAVKEDGVYVPKIYQVSPTGVRSQITEEYYISVSDQVVNLSLLSILTAADFSNIGIIIEASFTSSSDSSIIPSVFIPVSNATSEDLAKFSLHANDITMAVEDAKLVFNGTGLHVGNGNFEIIKTTDQVTEQLLYTNSDGDLHIKGTLDAAGGTFSGALVAASGTFSGELVAAEGTFSGALQAATGTLGDLTVTGTLTANNMSIASDGSIQSNYQPGISGFKLDSSGNVYANNIELGTSAKIKKYIKLGDSTFLYDSRIIKDTDIQSFDGIAYQVYENGCILAASDPTDNNKKMLYIKSDGTFNIAGKGRMLIGNPDSQEGKGIEINANDGANPYIMTTDYPLGSSSWRIDGNEAVFNNIVARGAIKSAVFEYSEIQTVGGIVIIRPSTTISSKSNNVLFVNSTSNFSVGDYCLLGGKVNGGTGLTPYKITEINSDMSTITLSGGIEDLEDSKAIGVALIDMGSGIEEVGLALNSSMNEPLAGITKQSLSVFSTKYNSDTNLIEINGKIILGKLPSQMAGTNMSYKGETYGLYAENAYLKGAIVSYGDNMSSGFDSNSNIPFSAPGITNPGKIVLWAGALNDNVEGAKFRVDTNGNIYAGSGYFSGTIITNSTIQASTLRAITIEGAGSNPGLTIKDVSNGIDFKNGDVSVFKLTSTSINSTLPLTTSDIIKAQRVYAGFTSSKYLSALSDNKLGFVKAGLDGAGVNNNFHYYFDVDDSNIYLRDTAKNSILTANKTEINISATPSGTIKTISQVLNIDAQNINYCGLMYYVAVPTPGGYNLYVN